MRAASSFDVVFARESCSKKLQPFCTGMAFYAFDRRTWEHLAAGKLLLCFCEQGSVSIALLNNYRKHLLCPASSTVDMGVGRAPNHRTGCCTQGVVGPLQRGKANEVSETSASQPATNSIALRLVLPCAFVKARPVEMPKPFGRNLA